MCILDRSEAFFPCLIPSLDHAILAYSATALSDTLWAGTNNGQILVFLLEIPEIGKRTAEKPAKVSAMLGKEIQLKHKAPVISIDVLDAGGLPVKNSGEDAPLPHKVKNYYNFAISFD